MTRYGAGTIYGPPTLYGELLVNEFDATPFTVVSNDYAKAYARWRKPGGAWDTQVLVRNSNGTPLDVQDGTPVLTQDISVASHDFQDDSLTPGRFYYYALFVHDIHENLWRRAGTAGVLIAKDWGYSRRIYDLLPAVYKSTDLSSVSESSLTEEQTFLFRFLSVFGFQFDHIRNEQETLRYVLDARTVSQQLLPALAAQVGVRYEPEIGSRALRRLVASAVHLWSLKGTLQGVRELADIVTGYSTRVRIGYNIALDDLDAGPKFGAGRWVLLAGGTTEYVNRTVDDPLPDPTITGYHRFTATHTPATVAPAGAEFTTDPVQRLQYAIPIIAELPYLPSFYVRAPHGTVQVGANWLDVKGVLINPDTEFGDPVTLDGTWQRPYAALTAPSGARYIEPVMVYDGTTVLEMSCFQTQESDTLRVWQCAREILVYLQATLVNYVGNTSGHGGSDGYSDGAMAAVDGDGNPYLSYSPESAADAGSVALVEPDSFTVLYTGDTPPVLAPAGQLLTYDVIVPVAAGQVWTALSEVTFPPELTTARVGFILYSGPEVVGEYFPDQDQHIDTEGWVAEKAELTVTSGDVFDGIGWAMYFPDAGSADTFNIRHNALELASSDVAFFFDGSTPSSTGDYLWEGTPYRSTSDYYPGRASRAARLRALLRNYLPYQSCFALVFAQGTIPDSPQAVSGYDVDPGDVVLSPSGRSFRLRYNTLHTATSDLALVWDTNTLEAGVDLSIPYDTAARVGASIGLVWDVEPFAGTAGVTIEFIWSVYAAVGASSTTLWNVDEHVAIEEGFTTP